MYFLTLTMGLAATVFVLYHLWDVLLILSPEVRLMLRSFFALIFIAGSGSVMAVLSWPRSEARMAAWIERRRPELRQDLTTVVQCCHHYGYSCDILNELARRSLSTLADGKKFLMIAPWQKRLAGLSLIPLIFIFAIWMLWPVEFRLSGKRLAEPWGEHGDWSGIQVVPGDARIPKGEELRLSLVGPQERSFALIYGPGLRLYKIPMQKSDAGLWAKLPPAEGDYHYRIILGRRQSRNYSVSVYQPLLLEEVKLLIEPPAYTGLQPVSLANQASFEAPAYSRVQLSARASGELKEAAAFFSKSGRRAVEVYGERISLSFAVQDDEEYRLQAISQNMADTFISAAYRITCLPDRPPEVEFLDEEDQTALGSDMAVSLAARAGDDYGLSKITVGFAVQGQRRQREIFKFRVAPYDTVFEYRWSLTELGLLPGDSVIYWLEAWDNDVIGGPKSGRSQERRLFVPSLAEMYQAMASQDSIAAAELSRLPREQNELRQQLERVAQAIKQNRRLNWQQQTAAEKALKEQQELLSRLEQATEQALQSLRPQGKQLNLDAETASKLRELQDLFEQVATEEMRKAMEQLQRALDKMDRQEVARALENLSLTSEDLKRKIDQAIEALKELQQWRQLESLNQDIQKLIREQKDIKAQTRTVEDRAERESLARRQEQAARDLKTLADQAKDLGQRLENQPQAKESLTKAAEALQRKGTSSKMSQAGQKISQGAKNEAQELQEQAINDMQSLLQAVTEAKNALGQSKSRAMAKAMRQKAKEILSLSQQQEDLNRMISSGRDMNDLAERQQSLARAGAKLQSQLSAQLGPMLPPQAMGSLSKAIKDMGQSAQDIMGSRFNQALSQGREALASLNQAAASLLEASSRSGSQGGGDMMQELEGLSGQQAEINQQAMGLMPSLGGEPEKLSPEIRSQMARLAAEQEAVRQGLEEFNLKYQDRRDRTQRLDDLVEEMKKVEDELRTGRMDRRTVERQERILNRLLEAQRSLRDQDFSQERKAEAGKYQGPPSSSSKSIPGYRPPPTDRSWQQEPYPLEYREIIEKYFRSLGW